MPIYKTRSYTKYMKNGCTHLYTILAISLIILSAGCTSDTPIQTLDEQTPEGTTPGLAKGDRLLGLALTEGAVGFGESFEIAQGLGVQVVGLPLAWDDIETSPGDYHNEYLDIANEFHVSSVKSNIVIEHGLHG